MAGSPQALGTPSDEGFPGAGGEGMPLPRDDKFPICRFITGTQRGGKRDRGVFSFFVKAVKVLCRAVMVNEVSPEV